MNRKGTESRPGKTRFRPCAGWAARWHSSASSSCSAEGHTRPGQMGRLWQVLGDASLNTVSRLLYGLQILPASCVGSEQALSAHLACPPVGIAGTDNAPHPAHLRQESLPERERQADLRLVTLIWM